jgi:phenylacetate-CoA ligase
VRAGQRLVSTYNAGPFVAGAALAAFDRMGLCHIPVGAGNTERLLRAIELLRPEAVVLTPSYAAHLVEAAEERDLDLSESSVERVLVAGEPGGGEPAFRATLEAGWGAKVTEAMGIGDIGPSLWGECEEQNGMHLGARGFVHAELVDPETGAARPLEDGAGASSCSRTCGTGLRRSSASARATTSRSGRALAPAVAPRPASVASDARTTCSSSGA